MSVLKRAGLYVMKNTGRSLLLFAILALTAAFVLSGLSIMNASVNTSARLRGTTGASFTVERNLSTGNLNSIGGGTSIIQQEFVTDAMIKDILKTDGIRAYTAKSGASLALRDLSGNLLQVIYENPKWDGTDLDYQLNAIGSFFSEYDKLFLSQSFLLTQGRHITDQDDHCIIISEALAKKHGLSVGDKVELYRQNWTTGMANAGDEGAEVEIVGLFKIIESQDDKNSRAPFYLYENYMFVSMNTVKSLSDWVDDAAEREGYEYADFYVDDPEQLETIIQNVQKLSNINWNNFNITVNDEVYERAAGSMSNAASLIRTLIIVIIVISAGMVALILSLWLKGRIRETGILMAMGISKPALLLQHVIESALIAVPAFCAAWLISQGTVGWMAGLFDSAMETEYLAISGADFMTVFIGGIWILLTAILISCISVFRYKPKSILSMME